MLVVQVLYASMLLPHFMSRPLVPWCLPYPAHCNQRLTRSITAGLVDLMCNTVRTQEHPCLCLSCVSTYLRMTLQLLVLYNIGLWPACLECIIIIHTFCEYVPVHRPPACTCYSAPGSGSLFYMMCLVIVHIYTGCDMCLQATCRYSQLALRADRHINFTQQGSCGVTTHISYQM